VKSSVSSRLRQYVSEFKYVLTSDGKVPFGSHVENLLSHNSVPNLHNINAEVSILLPLMLA
jgi:hypothetical protein